MLEKFLAELERLQMDGFEDEFPITGSRRMYAKMLQVVSDNLALNGSFGFIECFVADYF